jgi:hypothetical protein
MAESKALLCGLRITIETGINRLDVRRDSQLVIDQVMKNASCHDDNMEAYCNAVRALKDKFYDIELSHVPRRYIEEADKLTTIASGRITVPPNVFARDVANLSTNLKLTPSNQEEPSWALSNPAGAEPMDEDPSNEAYVLSLLEGYGVDEAEATDTEPAPHVEDWRDKYIACMDRGEPWPDTSPGWTDHSPLLTATRTSVSRQASCSEVCPFPRGASSSETFTWVCVATTCRRAPS